MTAWEVRGVPLRFGIGDWAPITWPLQLMVRALDPFDTQPEGGISPPADPCPASVQGFLVRGLRLSEGQPPITGSGDFICYVASKYRHYYVDLAMSLPQYEATFSSKTRSTLRRKVKRCAERFEDGMSWRAFCDRSQMREFFDQARAVSSKTYQERLLDAGLPDDPGFAAELEALAEQQRVRAYILFDGKRPVAYMCCPVRGDAVVYAYLGYDPEYSALSVGTVLQWFALEHLFGERRFRYFDFTEGESEHKRLFATGHVIAGNVFFLKRTLGNRGLVQVHVAVQRFSNRLGRLAEQWGVKSRIRRLIRFGLRPSTSNAK